MVRGSFVAAHSVVPALIAAGCLDLLTPKAVTAEPKFLPTALQPCVHTMESRAVFGLVKSLTLESNLCLAPCGQESSSLPLSP